MDHPLKVCVFIDGRSFYAGFKDASAGKTLRIDFGKLANYITYAVGGSRLWGVYYYTGVSDDSSGDSLARFLGGLKNVTGYYIKKFVRIRDDSKNSIVDRELETTLVCDMVSLADANAYDIAILVSGNGEYTPALIDITKKGKIVYIGSWGKSGISHRLLTYAFDVVDLSEGIDSFCSSNRRDEEDDYEEDDEYDSSDWTVEEEKSRV